MGVEILVKYIGEHIFAAIPKRGRGGRGVGGEFRRARAFRRSEAEAVSSVQKMFEQSLELSTNKIHIKAEGWLSGRRRRTRNAVYLKGYREFESHSLRLDMNSDEISE